MPVTFKADVGRLLEAQLVGLTVEGFGLVIPGARPVVSFEELLRAERSPASDVRDFGASRGRQSVKQSVVICASVWTRVGGGGALR
jgi:hypothetical protein